MLNMHFRTIESHQNNQKSCFANEIDTILAIDTTQSIENSIISLNKTESYNHANSKLKLNDIAIQKRKTKMKLPRKL